MQLEAYNWRAREDITDMKVTNYHAAIFQINTPKNTELDPRPSAHLIDK